MKKIVFTSLFYLLYLSLSAQQNMQFGQYIFNGLYINPAYAGYKDAIFAQAFYRAQWTGVKGAPQSLSVSIDAPINEKNLGIGAIITKDKIGAQNTLNGYVNLAYRLRLDHGINNVLAFGIGLGVMQTGINGNLLEASEIGDQVIPAGFESKIMPDIKAGVQYSNESFFIGFSANNLFKKELPVSSENALIQFNTQTHFYLTSALLFPLNMDLSFKPSFLIKEDLRGPTSLDLNTFLIFKDKFSIGASYRTSINLLPKSNLQKNLTKRSAVGFISDFLIKDKFRVGYGFDYSINKLGSQEYGSHEISIGYYFTIPRDKKSIFFCF